MNLNPFKKRPHTYSVVTDGEKFALKRSDGQFFDFITYEYWWSKETQFFIKSCWTDDEQKINRFLRRFEA